MLKAIKIRLYPNTEQVAFINKQLGCRLVYSQCLEHKKKNLMKLITSLYLQWFSY